MANNLIFFKRKPQDGEGVASGGFGPHDPNMEARVAVLEQIAKQTSETLADIRTDLAGIRADLRTDLTAIRADSKTGFEAARDRHERDFRITVGAIITVALGLAALMAKGFHWY